MVFTVPSEEERDPSDRGDEGANAEEELAALLLSRARLTSNAQTFFNTLPLEVFYLFLIHCPSFDTLFLAHYCAAPVDIQSRQGRVEGHDHELQKSAGR